VTAIRAIHDFKKEKQVAPRTFKIEIDKQAPQKVKAESFAEALRLVFTNAGEVRITPIPVPEYSFEVHENGGKVHKGTIRIGRKSPSEDEDT